MLRLMLLLSAMAACLPGTAAQAATHAPRPTAILGFTLDDTSLEGELHGSRPDEANRLAGLDAALQAALVASSCCAPVDVSRLTARLRAQDVRFCGGCDVALAREAGGQIVVSGWVQKVSNLILNINAVARDVASGAVIAGGSVDIRGNTDQSWSRGLAVLLRDRIHPEQW
jgi:hypothetical protein